MQTNAVFGLVGIGFIDPGANEAVGFSATATTLTISGGFESKPQKNSAGVHLESFYALADTSVEIEGITDATIGLVSRLRGGTLRSGSAALPAALRASPVRGPEWDGTTVAVAANATPAPGFYTIEKTAADPIVRQLFTASNFGGAGGAGTVATADFDVTTVPNALAVGAIGGFFLEPIATGSVGEYSYGSNNLPDDVSIFAVTEGNRQASPEGRNQSRVYIPRVTLNPIDEVHQMGELHALGTVGGMAKHDATIDGTYSVAYSFGT